MRLIYINAAKVGIASASAIVLALWFGWEKPQWAGITAVVLSASETFGHSIQKAQHRITGTIWGVVVAWLMMNYFAQEPFFFMAFFTIFSSLCCFLSFNPSNGYIFNMTAKVCGVICFSSALDVISSFNFSILRLQETLLGVFCYSIVFSFIYPITTESTFFHRFERIVDDTEKKIKSLVELIENGKSSEIKSRLNTLTLDIGPLKSLMTLLSLPLNDSYRLRFKVVYWQKYISDLIFQAKNYNHFLKLISNSKLKQREVEGIFNELLDVSNNLIHLKQAIIDDNSNSFSSIVVKDHQKAEKSSQLLSSIVSFRENLQQSLRELKEHCQNPLVYSVKPDPRWKVYAPKQNYSDSIIASIRTFLILFLSFALWVYLPIPLGFAFPVLVATMVLSVANYNTKIINKLIIAMTAWCSLGLLQYMFFLPKLTESWQLWLFYFFNLFFLWSIFNKREQAIHRIFGSIMLFLLTGKASQIIPEYDFTSPISTVLSMIILLLISKVVIMVTDTVFSRYRNY